MISLIYLLVISLIVCSTGEKNVICYYQSWKANQGITPEHLDANLCTYVIYAFIGMKRNGNLKAHNDNMDIGQGLYYRVTDMKKRNPKLKVLLSVGGEADGQQKIFSEIAADRFKRSIFARSASHFLKKYNFDGLDLDWEFPAESDKEHFIALLEELRTAFNTHNWMITAAVASNPSVGYDIPKLNRLLNFYNVMSYDMYGGWSSYTGQCSPLFASSVENSWERTNLNLASTGINWVSAGATKSKIAMGTAFYGRSFTLENPNRNGIHAPITGVGKDGGSAFYATICSNYSGWKKIWDAQQQNPYKYSGNQWIGYDDKDSIWIKESIKRITSSCLIK